ncbi:MFS transporter [Streptomyces uncialis]|uniref:MFS transporter n=1 Tax=Streptomyces uncialis TaxID=1048205 RepID=UPI00380CAFDE
MALDQHTNPDPAPSRGENLPRSAGRRRAWTVLALLFGLLLVNFADKVVVGLAGVDMKRDLGIDDEAFGVIQSSFYWLFAVGCVLGGWLGGRIGARWLLAGIAVVWALSLAPMVGQVGFTTVVACRVLLGFAEGPTTALAMQVTHSWFPAHRRALPSSLLVAGATVGPVIAAPALTWVITQYSWHAAFGVLAAVGALMAVLWLIGGREGPEGASAGHGEGAGASIVLPERLPLGRILRTGTLIGMTLLFFVAYANTSVKISWLPLYLREGLGYDAETTGRLVALPYVGAAVAVIVVGVISRSMTKRGLSSRTSRGLLAGSLVLGAGVATLIFPVLDRGAPQMILIVLSSCLNSAGYGIAFTGLADIVPAAQRGTVFGIVTGVYSLGGIIAPMVVGSLVSGGSSVAAGYGDGFLVLGLTMIAGAVAALFLVHPERDAAKLAAARPA